MLGATAFHAPSGVSEAVPPLPPLGRPIMNPLARRGARRDGIPVLRGRFPLAGHIPGLFGGALELMRIGTAEHGPLFWLDLGLGRHVLCFTHHDAWHLFKSRTVSSEHARERPAVDFVGGESLIATDGAEHARVRGALNPTFAPRGLTALELGPAFAALIESHIGRWGTRRSVALITETRELVLTLMFRMAGIPATSVAEWREHYERLAWIAVDLPSIPGTPVWRARRSRDWIEARISALLAEARANPRAGELLEALVNARDEHGERLGERQLVENVRLLLLAGHETSASTMAWATALCSRHEHVWERLGEEARAAPGVPRSPADLKRFPYAEAVFRESLRLYPPVSLDVRRIKGPTEIGGISLPVGADVLVPIGHLSRDASVYPEPDRFHPERWLARSAAPSPAELLQFGAGPHFCLGYHVAWLEIVQFLVALSRELGARGLRPRLDGPFPSPRYVPVASPPASLRVTFA